MAIKSVHPPTVTISVLTYNRCNMLKELLISLLNLNYGQLELIVVDNHSSDSTKEVVQGGFPQIKYFRTKRNLGASARNIGLAMASGQIIIEL